MVLSIISFLFVIAICVVIHEGGHYLAAVWRNVQVHEFAFGMGPKLFSRRRNGVLWAVRALPVGGFVRLDGMEDEPLPDDEPSDPERTFLAKKPWERFIVIAGGATFNIILAWLLTAVLLSCFGVYDDKSAVVGNIMEGYPAAEMGAQAGDRVISINGQEVNEWRDIRSSLQNLGDDNKAEVVVRRGDKDITLTGVIPADSASGARLWGIQPMRVKYSPMRSLSEGLSFCWRMSVMILQSLWQLVTGAIDSENLSGPVGIAVMAGNAARDGFWTFLSFLAIINLNLGLFNLLPLPALDGGHLVFLLGEMISGRKFPEKWENRVHVVGFALLMALIAFVTWKDIVRLIASD